MKTPLKIIAICDRRVGSPLRLCRAGACFPFRPRRNALSSGTTRERTAAVGWVVSQPHHPAGAARLPKPTSTRRRLAVGMTVHRWRIKGGVACEFPQWVDIGQIRVVDNADHVLNMRVEIDLTAEEVLARADTGQGRSVAFMPRLAQPWRQFPPNHAAGPAAMHQDERRHSFLPPNAAPVMPRSKRQYHLLLALGSLEQDRHRSRVGAGRRPNVRTPCPEYG